MKLSYSLSWIEATNHSHGEMTEDEARQAHESGKIYTVIVGDPSYPKAAIEVKSDAYVDVKFLDALSRTRLVYWFKRLDNRLFLLTMRIQEYHGDTNWLSEAVSMQFGEDGKVRAFRSHYAEGSIKALDLERGESSCDVSHHYAPMAEFGHYDDVLREDRENSSH